MQQCPKCSSDRIHRSRSKSRWERWRKAVTGKRAFRCNACGWRGWGVDEGPTFAEVERAIAERARVPEPPNLGRAGLARDVAKHRDVRAADLDAALLTLDDDTKPN